MLTLALAAVIAQQPTEMRILRSPDIHGDKIVFTHAADLWVMDRTDGIARRLTSHVGGEGTPRFSPDGKTIAFTGTYDGNVDVFTIPVEGGEPTRLTFTGTAETVLDWTPDGKIAFQSTFGSHTNRTSRLWVVGPQGGMPTRTPIEQVEDLSYSPDGSAIAYNRSASQYFWWRRYRGGTQGRVSIYRFATNSYEELPVQRENQYMPMWVGNTIFFISDRDFGTRNLFSYDLSSKRMTRLTEYRDADIRVPATDGKTIVWERGGFLESYEIATRRVQRVNASVRGEFLSARPRLTSVAGNISGFGLSPSGVRLAIEARGDIFSVPARNGETRNLTDTPNARERAPKWSPDGKVIAYLSDASGEVQIRTRPQMGGEEKIHLVDKRIIAFDWMPDSKSMLYQTRDGRLLLRDLAAGTDALIAQQKWQSGFAYDISADGSWIAFPMVQDNLQGALFLYNVEQKKLTKITDGYFDDQSVSFDQSGRYLYFVSGRTFNPAGGGPFEFMMAMSAPNRVYAVPLKADAPNPMLVPSDEEPVTEAAPPAPAPPAPAAPAPAPAKKGLEIDLEGLADRAIPLPWPAGSYSILGVNNGVVAFTQGGITLWNWQTRSPIPLYQGPFFGAAWNAKRTRIALRTPQGLATMALVPGQEPAPVNTAGMSMTLNPRAEWRQIFSEVWRFQRDVFYDPDMLGLDWEAIGKRYEQFLPFVNHRSDLNYVIGNMIGELGTGHAYVSGGEIPAGPGVPVGHLGVDYTVQGNFVRFGKIYRGLQFDESRRGPLGEQGVNVKEGDYLLAIDGKDVSARVDLHSLMQGKVGRTVALTVNSTPTKTGARTVRVRPIVDETELRYISWVEENRAYVAEKTGGRVGYLHIPDTSISGVVEFIKGFYSQVDKDGWIMDERYNGGGMIPTFFVEFMRRQVEAKMKARNWADIWFPTGTQEGPKAMLINEFAGSGGDMLPWLFRESKLGPLIGNRTWGGLVGIQGGAPIVDGGSVTSPGFGIYDPKTGKWIAENEGVEPDIAIDNRPDQVARGLDPQLDRAIQHVFGEVLRRGNGRPSRVPAFPRANPGR